MRTQQQTPVDAGTQSTDAGAVQAAGKAKSKRATKRGGDKVVCINTRLVTRLIEAGHNAVLALESPKHNVDLADCKARWISGVRDLIAARLKSGASYPHIDGVDLRKFYGATSVKDKRQILIEKLEARLAKLKAKK
jgi:hypothetical protein